MNFKLVYPLIVFLLFLNIYQTTEAAGIYSVYSDDGATVWAVGPSGNVIRSYDAGRVWEFVPVGTSNFYSVFVLNSYIWITSDSGTVQRSSDDGTTWTQTVITGANSLKSVYFANALTGWIAGSGGKIYKTTDRGENWTQQITSTANNLNSIKFFSASTGVACGSNGTLLITTNGGDNWTTSPTPVSKELLSVGIKQSTIVASGVDATVIKSTNLGNSWSVLDYKVQSKIDVNAVHVIDTNTFISVGGGGFIRIMFSNQSFIFGTNPYFGDLYTVFLSNSRGWAAGRNSNVVVRTSDAGLTWIMPQGASFSTTYSLVLPTNSWTYGNVFSLSPKNKSGIFVATARSIFRSLNKGDNWTQISSLDTGYAFANSLLISPKDSNLMLVSVEPNYIVGKVFRTSNYGATWTAVYTGRIDVDDIPLCMDPSHPDTVYLTPFDSVVLRSTNFGLTWSPAGSQRFSDACVIKVMEGYSNILLLGKPGNPTGYIYRSTDYGSSWAVVDSSSYPSGEVPAMAESNLYPGTVFATFTGGHRSGLHISPNNGGFWLRIDNNPSAWPLDIARDDYNVVGFGQVSGAQAFLSSTGGFGFSSVSIPTGITFAMLLYDRSTMLIQNSIGIYKVRFTYSMPIGITPISERIPQSFLLHPNYPNPFNPATRIRFDIPQNFERRTSNIELKIYDALGKEIVTLLNEQLKPGSYEIEWDASNYPSGVYFYKLTSGEYTEAKKMILLK